MGLRWEYDGALSDVYGNLTNVWTSQLLTVPVPPSSPVPTGNSPVGYVVPSNFSKFYGQPPEGVLQSSRTLPVQSGPPLNNFDPRFGFAWQSLASGKLVIRGGVARRLSGDGLRWRLQLQQPSGHSPQATIAHGITFQGAITTSGGVESRLGGASGGPGFFNTSVLCPAPLIGNGTDFGNSGVGIVLGPGQFSFDGSLAKITKVTERQSVQFRAEILQLPQSIMQYVCLR